MERRAFALVHACPPSKVSQGRRERDSREAAKPDEEQTLFMHPFLPENGRLRLQSARS